MKFPKDQNEVNAYFEKLAEGLKQVCTLRAGDNKRSFLYADEFMLMNIDDTNSVWFKHKVTRNYIIMHEDGTIVIPETNKAFMKGIF